MACRIEYRIIFNSNYVTSHHCNSNTLAKHIRCITDTRWSPIVVRHSSSTIAVQYSPHWLGCRDIAAMKLLSSGPGVCPGAAGAGKVISPARYRRNVSCTAAGRLQCIGSMYSDAVAFSALTPLSLVKVRCVSDAAGAFASRSSQRVFSINTGPTMHVLNSRLRRL